MYFYSFALMRFFEGIECFSFILLFQNKSEPNIVDLDPILVIMFDYFNSGSLYLTMNNETCQNVIEKLKPRNLYLNDFLDDGFIHTGTTLKEQDFQ